MTAVASVSSSASGNGPASLRPEDDPCVANGARIKTLDDIRKVVHVADRELTTFPTSPAEQIHTLKIARKEIVEFYSSLSQKAKEIFLKSGHLERVDPELWFELLEPYFENLFDQDELFELYSDFLTCPESPRLSRVCREIISLSDLPLRVKFASLRDDDLDLLTLVQESCISTGAIIQHERFKQYILESRTRTKLSYWMRKGVISPERFGDYLNGDTLLALPPSTITKLSIQFLSLSNLGEFITNSDLNRIGEKLALIREDVVRTSEAKEKIQAARENLANTCNPIGAETEALWRRACRDAGVLSGLTLNDLVSREIFDELADCSELPKFLSWYNSLSEEERALSSEQIVSTYESEHQSDSWKVPTFLASILGRDSLPSKHRILADRWEAFYIIKSLVHSDTPIPAPESIQGFSAIFDEHHLCIRSWVKKYQKEILTLLEERLAAALRDRENIAVALVLQDIHAGLLFLKEYKPKECQEMLSRIIETEEYHIFTAGEGAPHRTAVRVAYHQVTSLPRDVAAMKEESQLFDSSKLYWTTPAGNRWIFMEGLEAPKHEVLLHACSLLREITEGELRVNVEERFSKSASLTRRIEAARERIESIDAASLTEVEQIFHAALLPLYGHLELWSKGERPDIEMIVDIENSGLARISEPTDQVKVAAGNHLDFLQKMHHVRGFSCLSRECPVLDSERFTRNLLRMAEISAEVLANRKARDDLGVGSDKRHPIPPEIPKLNVYPEVLYMLSDTVRGDARYLTTSLYSRMASDYSYIPISEGPLSDFIATITRDDSGEKVRLSVDMASSGTIIPCPHHSAIEPDSVRTLLENFSIAIHPDGGSYLWGGAGFAELSVTLKLPVSSHEFDLFMTCEEARDTLPSDVYNQLTLPIATLEELPAPLQQAILEARSMSVAQAAEFLESFVRDNYTYSFGVANTKAYREFQAQRETLDMEAREENAYLKMIHDLGDDTWLGKGVCGQLSTVLLASLRLAGVPCLMTSGYLAAEKEVDENMAHAYVSAVLRTQDGSWRYKILEATGGGIEGLIALQRMELQLLQETELAVRAQRTPVEQSHAIRVEPNKWAWIAEDLGGRITALSNHDADLFYLHVMACLGLQAKESPSAEDVANAYGRLIGSVDDRVDSLDAVVQSYPQLRGIMEIAKKHRVDMFAQVEASFLGDVATEEADWER